MIYEVGKPYHINCPNPGADFALIQPLEGGAFDVLMYMNSPSFNEKIQAKTGKMRYAVFENSSIPFFIVQFDSFSFDASMNVLKIPEQKREEWISLNANGVTLFLIDSKTNIIKSIRFIGIEQDSIETLKNACKNQIKTYRTSEDIDRTISNICSRYSISDMFDHSYPYQL